MTNPSKNLRSFLAARGPMISIGEVRAKLNQAEISDALRECWITPSLDNPGFYDKGPKGLPEDFATADEIARIALKLIRDKTPQVDTGCPLYPRAQKIAQAWLQGDNTSPSSNGDDLEAWDMVYKTMGGNHIPVIPAEKVKEFAGENLDENITTFPDEEILLQMPNGEALVHAYFPGTKRHGYVAVTKDGFRTDYPLFIGGKVFWDNPEWFTNKFRDKAAEQILADVGENEVRARNMPESTVPEIHQKRIAIRTLQMNDVGARIMGGMTKEEAREILKSKWNYSDEAIRRIEGGGDVDVRGRVAESHYCTIISAATGETDPRVLDEIEEIMRHDIYHGTLDWQSREELESAACEANAARKAMVQQEGKAKPAFPTADPKFGWGDFTPGRKVTSFDKLKADRLYLMRSPSHGGLAHNVVHTTNHDQTNMNRDIMYGWFVDPRATDELRLGAESNGFSIWPHDLDRDEWFEIGDSHEGAYESLDLADHWPDDHPDNPELRRGMFNRPQSEDHFQFHVGLAPYRDAEGGVNASYQLLDPKTRKSVATLDVENGEVRRELYADRVPEEARSNFSIQSIILFNRAVENGSVTDFGNKARPASEAQDSVTHPLPNVVSKETEASGKYFADKDVGSDREEHHFVNHSKRSFRWDCPDATQAKALAADLNSGKIRPSSLGEGSVDDLPDPFGMEDESEDGGVLSRIHSMDDAMAAAHKAMPGAPEDAITQLAQGLLKRARIAQGGQVRESEHHNIEWNHVRPDADVRLVGKPGAEYYVTGDGGLPFWSGHDAVKAQDYLEKLVRKTAARKGAGTQDEGLPDPMVEFTTLAPSGAAPNQPEDLDVGDEVEVVDGGKPFKGLVKSRRTDGSYDLSFDGARPVANTFKRDAIKKDKRVPGQPTPSQLRPNTVN